MLRNLTLLAVIIAALTLTVLAILAYLQVQQPPRASFSEGTPRAICFQTPLALECHILQAPVPVFLLPKPNGEAEPPGLN